MTRGGHELRLGDQRGGMKRHETTQTGGVQDSGNIGLDRTKRRKGMNGKELQKKALGTDRKGGMRRGEAWGRRRHSETRSTRQPWSPCCEHRHRMMISMQRETKETRKQGDAREKDIFPVTKTSCYQLPQSEPWNWKPVRRLLGLGGGGWRIHCQSKGGAVYLGKVRPMETSCLGSQPGSQKAKAVSGKKSGPGCPASSSFLVHSQAPTCVTNRTPSSTQSPNILTHAIQRLPEKQGCSA